MTGVPTPCIVFYMETTQTATVTHYLPYRVTRTLCDLDKWSDDVHWTRQPALITCPRCLMERG